MLFGDSETLEGRTRGTKDELQVPCPSSLALKSGETKQIHALRHRQFDTSVNIKRDEDRGFEAWQRLRQEIIKGFNNRYWQLKKCVSMWWLSVFYSYLFCFDFPLTNNNMCVEWSINLFLTELNQSVKISFLFCQYLFSNRIINAWSTPILTV